MTVPMIILAVGSVGRRRAFLRDQRPAGQLARAVGGPLRAPGTAVPAIVVTIATLAVVAVGVFIAYWFIGRRPVPVTPPMPVPAIVTLARNDVGGNAVNETLFARPGIWLSRASVYADAKGVDGLVNGSAAALGGLSGRWRHWQNGYVRSYACRCSRAPWSWCSCCCW